MKKKIYIPLAIFLSALVITIVAVSIINKKSKVTTVAFYDIPEDVQKSIQENVRFDKVQFIQIDEKNFLSKKLSNKADVVISYNNAQIQNLSNSSSEVSAKIQAMYPNSIRNSKLYTNEKGKMTVLPVLLDNFEFGVLKITQTRYGAKLPESIFEIDDFCNHIKSDFPLPIIISGADDINLNSFFSLFIQSFGGLEGYLNVADQLAKTEDFSKIYDYKIGGDAPEDYTIRTVLNEILYLQEKGHLNSKWMNNTKSHTDKFIENAISAISFMNMSEQRNKPKPNANYYVPETFPLQTAKKSISIQPAIVAVDLKKSSTTKNIFEQLSSVSTQENLSEETKLAPAILQGETYDSLTTIARFNAASYASGPIPDLGTLAFTTKKDQHKLAQSIRSYFGE